MAPCSPFDLIRASPGGTGRDDRATPKDALSTPPRPRAFCGAFDATSGKGRGPRKTAPDGRDLAPASCCSLMLRSTFSGRDRAKVWHGHCSALAGEPEAAHAASPTAAAAASLSVVLDVARSCNHQAAHAEGVPFILRSLLPDSDRPADSRYRQKKGTCGRVFRAALCSRWSHGRDRAGGGCRSSAADPRQPTRRAM